MILISYPAHAQVISGTIVILNLTKDKTIVAADSLAVNQETRVPDYSYCKIATFGHQLIFTSVGNSAWADSGRIVWDNAGLARDAFHSIKQGEHGGIDLDDIAGLWARGVKGRWNSVDRKRTADIAAINKGQITAGAFIGNRSAIKVAVVYFNAANALDPIQFGTGDGASECWPCGQLQGSKICGAGVHLDVAAKFCSERKHGDKISVRTTLRGASESTKLAVKIVEMTIDAYEKTAGDVGGVVDSVTITKAGTITWNSRKKSCPENQN
jgi:hypothetical protein